MIRPALTAPPVIAGLLMRGIANELWEVNGRELVVNTPLALGGTRQTLLHEGAGRRLIVEKFEVALAWEHMGILRGPLARRLKIPGPHQVILWHYEYLTFVGNGARREFLLPWHPVRDVWTAALPENLTDEKVAPVVRLTGPDEADAVLTYSAKTPVDYAAGEPATGNVWFSVGEMKFKVAIADTPAAGAFVYVDMVPVLSMFTDGANERSYKGPIREPRKLNLVER